MLSVSDSLPSTFSGLSCEWSEPLGDTRTSRATLMVLSTVWNSTGLAGNVNSSPSGITSSPTTLSAPVHGPSLEAAWPNLRVVVSMSPSAMGGGVPMSWCCGCPSSASNSAKTKNLLLAQDLSWMDLGLSSGDPGTNTSLRLGTGSTRVPQSATYNWFPPGYGSLQSGLWEIIGENGNPTMISGFETFWTANWLAKLVVRIHLRWDQHRTTWCCHVGIVVSRMRHLTITFHGTIALCVQTEPPQLSLGSASDSVSPSQDRGNARLQNRQLVRHFWKKEWKPNSQRPLVSPTLNRNAHHGWPRAQTDQTIGTARDDVQEAHGVWTKLGDGLSGEPLPIS